MSEFLSNLDRRWIFLAMGISIAIPMLLGLVFPEEPSPEVIDVFNAVETLEDGSNILMAYDYDPASKGELEPMAAAFVRHCAEKRHKLFFITLWPAAIPMLQKNIAILKREYPGYTYGEHYVNLGFRPGNEGVIKVVVTDLKKLYGNDVNGTDLNELPMTANVKNIQSMDLIVNVSAGTPGSKEWVQYAATPFGIRMVAGVTGVGYTPLVPYVPDQLAGILGAIKAAAEYEEAVMQNYPELRKNHATQEGLRRMGPQLVAHMLVIVLIIVGNIIFFMDRKRGIA
ncbi:MAG: hypothetical protein VB859_13010 [Planctomycetaceae bacterium]